MTVDQNTLYKNNDSQNLENKQMLNVEEKQKKKKKKYDQAEWSHELI